MNALSVVILLLTISHGYCLPRIRPSPRILNGVDANDKEYPYMVSIVIKGFHTCGASILTENWLLTAAHCCLTIPKIDVYSGSVKLYDGGRFYSNANYVLHPNYDTENFWRNDICLIKLGQPLQFDEKVQPVALPLSESKQAVGTSAEFIGWGSNSTVIGARMPTSLQSLHNYIILSNEECIRKIDIVLYEGQICAEGGLSRGACHGDSGGPLTFEGVQIGLASFVRLPCGSGYPDVFTRVSHYIDWIKTTLGVDASKLKFSST